MRSLLTVGLSPYGNLFLRIDHIKKPAFIQTLMTKFTIIADRHISVLSPPVIECLLGNTILTEQVDIA